MMNFAVKIMLSIVAFIVVYFNAVCAKPLSSEMPFLNSQAFNQFSQGQDSQPVVDAIEPEDNISQESNRTSDVIESLERPVAHDRIARNTRPCVLKVLTEFDSCRNLRVDKVECKESQKCRTVYDFRDPKFVSRCSALPIDCQYAS